MKHILRTLPIAILLFAAMALTAQTRDFTFSNNAQREGLSVEQSTRSGLSMRHSLKQLHILNITDNGYTGDVIQGGTGISLPANEGEPNLPSFSRFVAIPNGANAHIEMGYRSMTTIANVDLLPAAPIKFDTDDSPNTYEKNLSSLNSLSPSASPSACVACRPWPSPWHPTNTTPSRKSCASMTTCSSTCASMAATASLATRASARPIGTLS